MRPRIIMQGKQRIDMSKDMVTFGAYYVVYVKTTNDLIVRILPGISLIEPITMVDNNACPCIQVK